MTPPNAPTAAEREGEEPQQPSAQLLQVEEEQRRERLPEVLRRYATDFERYYVPDSDAGRVVWRAADEIEQLRAALLAARRGEEAAINSWSATEGERLKLDQENRDLRTALNAAIAAMQEET